MNGFYLVGRIMEVPDKSETSSGLPMCRLKVGVNRTYKDGEDDVDVFDVVLFRSLAQGNYAAGQSVAINGKIQANNFDKEGTVYYHANLIGNSITVIS